ncbi:transporter [Geovibrio thiophilus]|uniref:Transporter n=1 Tax=Geovibrio thiophilus TaxID=139438 RepID=A0A410JZ17_9BACT|nr:transporter [Geovibrio thiophilus]QAR33291.1 transporter [Geovibrio thiophilus]
MLARYMPITFIKIRKAVIVLLLLFLVSAFSPANAQDYALGSEGIKAASIPGPGFYYVMYNQYFSSDEFRDRSGDKIDNPPEIKTFANVHRFIWMTKKKILGADYGMNLIIPAVYVDIETAAGDDSEFNIGDTTIEPLTLAWHGKRYDAVFGAAMYLPTGEYDKSDLANTGNDHYTLMTTYGVTFYPDEDKLWSVSVLARHEKHFENRDLDITYGDDLNLEWGVGRTIGIFDAGLSGYAHWQITDDSGKDVSWDKSVHDRKFGIGPELNAFISQINGQVKIKYYKEFSTEDSTEGNALWLTFSTKL